MLESSPICAWKLSSKIIIPIIFSCFRIFPAISLLFYDFSKSHQLDCKFFSSFLKYFSFYYFFLDRENVELDIPAVYHQLVDTYHSSDSEIEVEATRERPSTSRQRPTTSRNLRSQEVSKDWRVACRQLLETLWQCEDSIPFRYVIKLFQRQFHFFNCSKLIFFLFTGNPLID